MVYDEDARYARELVGADQDGNALPGVVVLLPGRRVHFRKMAEVKDDRVHARELLAIVDQALLELGRTPPTSADLLGGYAPQSRWQLAVAVSAGENFTLGDTVGSASLLDAASASLGGSVMLQAPLGRAATAGVRAAFFAGEDQRFDLGAAPRLRLPAFDDLAEIYLLMPVGLALDPSANDPRSHDSLGLHAGGRLGLQFALWPAWAPFVDVGVMHRRFGGAGAGQPHRELFTSAALGLIYLP